MAKNNSKKRKDIHKAKHIPTHTPTHTPTNTHTHTHIHYNIKCSKNIKSSFENTNLDLGFSVLHV